jgi:hypothetical protein
LHKRDAFPNKWIWFETEMDVIANSHVSVDNGFDTCGVSSKYELCDGREGGSCGGDEEEKTKCDLKPATSISKAHTANKTVKPFYVVHGVSTRNKETVLNLELALFHLHTRFQPKEL